MAGIIRGNDLRFSLRPRTVKQIKMQRPLLDGSGGGMGVGHEYLEVSDRTVVGPYQTGCDPEDASRWCLQVPMQKSKDGKIIRVSMQQSGGGFHVHYRAEDLVGWALPGAPLVEWWDYRENYDLVPCQEDDVHYLIDDVLNGYPVVRIVSDIDPDTGEYRETGATQEGFKSEKIAEEITDVTVYCVWRHFANGTYAQAGTPFCTVYQGEYESPAPCNMSSSASQMEIGFYGRNVSGNQYVSCFNGNGNNNNEDYSEWRSQATSCAINCNLVHPGQACPSPSTWNIMAIRFPQDASQFCFMSDGTVEPVPMGLHFSEYGYSPTDGTTVPTSTPQGWNMLPFAANSMLIQLGWGQLTSWDMEIAEVEMRGWSDTTETMLARSQQLAIKYGLPCAGL